jgi:hypothetical protein
MPEKLLENWLVYSLMQPFILSTEFTGHHMLYGNWNGYGDFMRRSMIVWSKAKQR